MIFVVLSPHRDDAAFSLGLSVDAWLAAGHTVSVLNFFTQSEYAPYSDAEALHPNDRVSFVSAVRKREDIAWGKLAGGRLSFHDLDLLDAPLRLGCAVDEVLTAEVRAGDRALARAEGAIAKLGRKAEASGLVILAPLAVGGHIDHRLVHQAALNVHALTPLPLAFYEDLPYAAREGEAGGLPDRAAGTLPGMQSGFASAEEREVEGAVRRKTRLCECYDSQVDSEVVRSMAEFCVQYAGRERFWTTDVWRTAIDAGGAKGKA